MPQSFYKNIEKKFKVKYIPMIWSMVLFSTFNKEKWNHLYTQNDKWISKEIFVLDKHESNLNAVTRWMY